MATEKKTKRKNKRKSRTEAISSSSPSSSDSDSSSPPPKKSPKPKLIPAEPESPPTISPKIPDFESLYLSKITAELANDLDKLRSAKDFDPKRSVPLLIAALKQGSACFSAEERGRITTTTTTSSAR